MTGVGVTRWTRRRLRRDIRLASQTARIGSGRATIIASTSRAATRIAGVRVEIEPVFLFLFFLFFFISESDLESFRREKYDIYIY